MTFVSSSSQISTANKAQFLVLIPPTPKPPAPFNLKHFPNLQMDTFLLFISNP